MLSGVLSIVFGVLIFIFPLAGALTITWLIGMYAILFGAMFLSLGLRLRKNGLYHKGAVTAS